MKKHLNWLLPLLLIVAVTVYALLTPSETITLDITEEGLTVTAPDKAAAYSAAFSEVAAIHCVDVSDYGVCVEGDTRKDTCWGLWERDGWGRYELAASRRSSCLILLTRQDGSLLAFNYQTTEDTRQVYEGLLELMGE